MNDLLLPEATRLVHIGPPKTATTSLQASFHAAREVLAEHGVHYAGQGRHAMLAAVAAVGGKGFLGGPAAEGDHWSELVAEIQDAGADRVVFSSEYLAQAKAPAVRRVVSDLGVDRMHVVATLRPLHKILPSQWQQYIQTGYKISYDEWLTEMFSDSPRKGLTPSFWIRHRHDQLVQRWADEVGTDSTTVIVLDPRDHAEVLRVFEQMVGVPGGTLDEVPDLSNRSLTLGEVEMVRAFNAEFRRRDWPDSVHFDYFRNGSIREMRTRPPEAGEARIETPRWAIERVADLSAQMVDNLASTGVRIVGDLSTLVAPRPGDEPEPERADDHAWTDPEAAALALVGILRSRHRAVRRPRAADRTPGRELLGELGRRVTRRTRRTAL